MEGRGTKDPVAGPARRRILCGGRESRSVGWLVRTLRKDDVGNRARPLLGCEAFASRRRSGLAEGIAVGDFRKQRQLFRQLTSKRSAAQAPGPVAAGLAGDIYQR